MTTVSMKNAFGRHLAGALVIMSLVVLGSQPTVAQETPDPGLLAPGSWQAHPSMNRVQAATTGAGHMWGGTDGGLFSYDLASGEITRYTTVQGLSGSDVRTLFFDERHDIMWIGYPTGVLDRLDVTTGEIATYFDIARADRYPQRGINRFRPHGDLLLIATDFGAVVFDIEGGEVIDTYDKFSDFDRGQEVYDFQAAPLPDGVAGFWVGTRDGVAFARQDAPSLRVPSAWTIDETAPGPAIVLGHFAGTMHLGKAETPGEAEPAGDWWRRQTDGVWTRQHVSGRSVYELVIEADRMSYFSTFNVGTAFPDGTRRTVVVSDTYGLLSGAHAPDGRLWVGSSIVGLGELPPLPPSGSISAERFIVPSGPLSNAVDALDISPSGDIWIGIRPRVGVVDGMGRFDGTSWTNYSTLTGFDAAHARIRVIEVDSRGMAWGVTEGRGVMRVDPDGQVVVFDSDNSPLTGEPGSPNFIVSLGVAEDDAGRVWVTNRNAPAAMHVWSPDDGWISVPRPTNTPAGSWFGTLHIDNFDQKWTGLVGDGFMVTRTAAGDLTDTESVVVVGTGSAATGTGLPNQNVQAIVQDLDGRIWIGTERGLATVFSPGSVFANPALAQPAWARTPDQASYFLRDLNILAMTVDPAGRKWLASSDGAWLLNAAGNQVEQHFTPENSPLPSSTVLDVAVDERTGMVWFATDRGVMSYRGLGVEPAATAERLRVYPSPYRPEQDPFVRVEGLVAETRIRILTPDGQVVAAFEARGGTATWDGRDQRTGQLVPSGVYLVAAAGLNGEGTAFGKIAIIR